MGSWKVDLDGVRLSGGGEYSHETGCLNTPPEGLGHPAQRTEDTTYPQRDGVRHFQDWYEPRIVTLPDVTVCGDSCGCHSEEPQLLVTNLADDPSFEYGTGQFDSTENGAVTWDSTRARTGSHSLLLTSNGGGIFNPNAFIFGAGSPLMAGDSVSARVWVWVPRLLESFDQWGSGPSGYLTVLSGPILNWTATQDQPNNAPLFNSNRVNGDPSTDFTFTYKIRKGNPQAPDVTRMLLLCYDSAENYLGTAVNGTNNNIAISEDWAEYSFSGMTPPVDTATVRAAIYPDTLGGSNYETGDRIQVKDAILDRDDASRPEIRLGGTGVPGTNSPDFTGPYETWAPIEVTVVATADASTIVLYLYGAQWPGEQIWFDDLSVVVNGQPESFSGDTPADEQHHYEWVGVPGESNSQKWSNRKRTARQKLADVMGVWDRRCEDTELVLHTDCEGDGPVEEVGPYGIIGRPRVAEIEWVKPSTIKCANLTLRFDAVDHRLYLLDPSGEPGSGEQCLSLSPVVNTLCRTYDRCYNMCYTEQLSGGGSAEVLATNLFPNPSYEYNSGQGNGWSKIGTGDIVSFPNSATRAHTGSVSQRFARQAPAPPEAAHSVELAPSENVPTFISFYDATTYEEPTIASAGWWREKREGFAVTDPGDSWQNDDAPLDLSDPRFYYGAIPGADGHPANPTQFAGTDYKPGSTASAQAASWLMNLRFVTSSPEVQLRLRAPVTDPSLGVIWVDGRRVQERSVSSTGIPAGSAYHATLTFPDSRERTIEVTGLNNIGGDFGGVAVNQGHTVARPNDTRVSERRIAIIGDSYVNGAGDVSGTETFAWRLAALMGATDIVQAGIGGTGWLAMINGDDPVSTFSGRIAPVLAMNPDIIIFAGGRNDSGYTQTEIYNEIISCVGQVTDTDIPILLAPTGPDGGDSQAAMQQAGVDSRASYLDVSVDSLPKIPDGIHPTYEGHQEFANDLYAAAPEPPNEFAQYRANFSVTSGETYTFSAWIWADAPPEGEPLRVGLDGTAFPTTTSDQLALFGSWQLLQVTATATSTAVGQARLHLQGIGDSQSVWVDDVGFGVGGAPVDFNGDTPPDGNIYHRWVGAPGNSPSEQYIPDDTPAGVATVEGSLCVNPTVTLNGPLTNPVLENVTNGTKLTYRGIIPPGTDVIVGTETGVATDGEGNSRTHLVDSNLVLDVGENELRLTSYSTTDDGNVEVCWRGAVTFA